MRNVESLSPTVVDQIRDLAKKCGLDRVILFGSRARGDHHQRSDIDLAISGGNVARFSVEVNEGAVRTLLMIDTVSLDDPVSKQLQANIDRDGVLLYAKD